MVGLKLTLSSSILRWDLPGLKEESHDNAARAKRKKTEAACSGCGGRGVAFEWRAGAIVTAGNEGQGKGETGADDAKQILLQHQSPESGQAHSTQGVDRQADRGTERDRGDGKSFEFQYSPSNVSLAELADWVEAEGKCCRFFDFHIDLEREGTLLCLRLTGEEGIKPFIRTEFQVPAK